MSSQRSLFIIFLSLSFFVVVAVFRSRGSFYLGLLVRACVDHSQCTSYTYPGGRQLFSGVRPWLFGSSVFWCVPRFGFISPRVSLCRPASAKCQLSEGLSEGWSSDVGVIYFRFSVGESLDCHGGRLLELAFAGVVCNPRHFVIIVFVSIRRLKGFEARRVLYSLNLNLIT